MHLTVHIDVRVTLAAGTEPGTKKEGGKEFKLGFEGNAVEHGITGRNALLSHHEVGARTQKIIEDRKEET